MKINHPSPETEACWKLLFHQMQEAYGVEMAAKATQMACQYQRENQCDWEPAYLIGIRWMEKKLIAKLAASHPMDDMEYCDILASQEAYEQCISTAKP